MSIAGYPVRGNPILGVADYSDMDNLPYTTISFANGPGFRNHTNGSRYNVVTEDMNKIDYRQDTGIPLKYETHGGEDVFIFSKGPYSHYLTGVNFQNYIPHVMAYASCIAPEGATKSPLCEKDAINELDSTAQTSTGTLAHTFSFGFLCIMMSILMIFGRVQNRV